MQFIVDLICQPSLHWSQATNLFDAAAAAALSFLIRTIASATSTGKGKNLAVLQWRFSAAVSSSMPCSSAKSSHESNHSVAVSAVNSWLGKFART